MTKQPESPSTAPPPKANILLRFLRARRGVAAIEFGMVSIPLLGLICAIVETAFVYFVHGQFDYAISKVQRSVMVNTFSTNATQSMASFRTTYVCPVLPAYFNCSYVILNIQAYSSTTNFSTVGAAMSQAWYSSPTANVNLGAPGNIVVLQAFYPMPVYLSILVATGPQSNAASNLLGQTSKSVFTNPNGAGFVHAIFTTYVFRNEPQ
jgi:Flp pilus assembly protein TadG